MTLIPFANSIFHVILTSALYVLSTFIQRILPAGIYIHIYTYIWVTVCLKSPFQNIRIIWDAL